MLDLIFVEVKSSIYARRQYTATPPFFGLSNRTDTGPIILSGQLAQNEQLQAQHTRLKGLPERFTLSFKYVQPGHCGEREFTERK